MRKTLSVSPVQLRPTQRDLDNIKVIESSHPEFANTAEIIRHALEIARRYAENEKKQVVVR